LNGGASALPLPPHSSSLGCGGLSDCEELVGVIHRRNWAKFAERIAACFFAGYLSSWN